MKHLLEQNALPSGPSPGNKTRMLVGEDQPSRDQEPLDCNKSKNNKLHEIGDSDQEQINGCKELLSHQIGSLNQNNSRRTNSLDLDFFHNNQAKNVQN